VPRLFVLYFYYSWSAEIKWQPYVIVFEWVMWDLGLTGIFDVGIRGGQLKGVPRAEASFTVSRLRDPRLKPWGTWMQQQRQKQRQKQIPFGDDKQEKQRLWPLGMRCL
jgi:hypothetical protein